MSRILNTRSTVRNLGWCLALLCHAWPSAAAEPGRAQKPLRIVSCTVASDEVLLDLLERAGHVDRLQGVSTLSEDARYSNVKIPKTLTGRCGGELESTLKLKPDLVVVASFNRPELVRRLKDAKVQVHVLRDFKTLDDVADNLTDLGAAIGEPEAAEAARREFDVQRQRLKGPPSPRAEAPLRALEFFQDSVVSGRGTLFDDLVRHAGGLNVAGEKGLQGWPRLQAEALAELKPDVIIAAGDPADTVENKKLLEQMRALAGFKEIPAVKAGRVIYVPQREMSAASPHILKALARIRAGFAAQRTMPP